MRNNKQFTFFHAITIVSIFIGIILICMIFIAPDRPAHAKTNPNCLTSKARLTGFSVEICMTSATAIEGYLQFAPTHVYDFTGITITSPESLQVRVYVLDDNLMPTEFSTGSPVLVSSPNHILTAIEQQYGLMGVKRKTNSPRLTVNRNVINGLSFDINSENPDNTTQSSYWPIRAKQPITDNRNKNPTDRY